MKRNREAVRRESESSSGTDSYSNNESDAEDSGHRKKRNKHAPTEMPTNRPVGRFRQVVDVPKKERRDPRFDPTSGKFKPDLFNKSYAFLEEYRDQEIANLSKQLKKNKNQEEKEALKQELTQLKMQRGEDKRAKNLAATKRDLKRAERESIASGSNPYFAKRRELKELEIIEKFKELESKGGASAIEKAIAKRRKKVTSSDRRRLPPSFGK